MAPSATTCPSASRRGRIASSVHLEPFQQGEFDGLCGIYAAVNGLRLLLEPHRPLSYSRCEQLYQSGVERLKRDDRLAFAATWGISQSRWRNLVTSLCRTTSRITKLAVSATQPFPAHRRHARADVFASVDAAIDAQHPVLVSLGGTYSHYSVICGYSPTRFLLHDSYGYSWISKASCGVTLDPGEWRHRIATRSLLVLTLHP